jgi:hypothetical protein
MIYVGQVLVIPAAYKSIDSSARRERGFLRRALFIQGDFQKPTTFRASPVAFLSNP